MRRLLAISAIAILSMGSGAALADPVDPDAGSQSGHTCIGTMCKGEMDPLDDFPPMPPPTICMQTVGDDATPPEDQWDGCVLP